MSLTAECPAPCQCRCPVNGLVQAWCRTHCAAATLSFPVAAERLDNLTQFLWPEGVRPLQHKTVESIEIMLQLVAFRRGVCALPRWLAKRYGERLPLTFFRLGLGIQRTLYAAIRREESSQPHLQKLLAK